MVKDELTDMDRRCLQETSEQHPRMFSGPVIQVLTMLPRQNAWMVSHAVKVSFIGATAE